MLNSNKSKNILLYVSGSISCFKSCSLISMLKKNDYDVRVIASEDALKFVGKASFEGLTHHKIHTDLFNDEFEIPHIELASQLGVELDESGHIITDKNQKTNIDYVYAIGDVCVGLKQWVVACGEGAVAATSAFEDIT